MVFTSCKEDDVEVVGGGNGIGGGDLPDVPVLSVGEFSVAYPENHTFRGYDIVDEKILIGDYKTGHIDSFMTYMTMDSVEKNVRIIYCALLSPETVEASDVDAIAKVMVNDVYSTDAGYELIANEVVPFAGYSAARIAALHKEAQIFKERYVFYDEKKKKVYSVRLEMPESLRASRYKELTGIIKSLKIK